MAGIIFKISLIVLLVAFLVFLAYDDYRNRKAREAEDKLKAAALTGSDRRDAEEKDTSAN